MIRHELKKFNNLFDRPKVINKIRRIINGSIISGHCVLIDFEDVKELTLDQFNKIISGWAEEKVKIISCQKFK